MSRIFMSYRRLDSISESGRIHDHLEREFSEKNVFKDVDDIEPGEDFRKVLEEEVTHCDIFLAIIGPKWASITDSAGNPRLFNPDDFVRIEVETGLARNDVLVVPVLVNGAVMPSANELPESLHELMYRNAVIIRNDPDFSRDISRLIQYIHRYRDNKPKRRNPFPVQKMSMGVVIALIAIIIVMVVINQPPKNEDTIKQTPSLSDDSTPTQSQTVIKDTPASSIGNADVQTLMVEAQDTASNGDYETAIDLYSQAIALDVNFAQAYFGRGLAYVSGAGNFTAAIADLKQAVTLNPDYGEAFSYLGSYQYQNADYEAVELNLTRALQLNPNDIQARSTLGEYYISVGQSDKAVAQYDALTGLITDDPSRLYDAWINKAYAYEVMGSTEDAIKAYQTARDMNPDNSRAYFQLGNLYLYEGQYDLALENLDTAIEQGDPDSDLYFARGLANQELANYSDAIKDFDRALQLNPSNINIYIQRGRTKFELNDYLPAIADLSQAITRDPTIAEAYYYRGLTYYKRESWDAALDDFSSIIELNSDLVGEAYVNRGMVYAQIDENGEAISNLVKGIDYGVNNDSLYYDALIDLGWAKLSLEDYGGALDQFTIAINYAPDRPDAYEGQANVFIDQADSTDNDTKAQSAWISALDSVNRGLDAAGDSAELYYARGYVQFQLNLLNDDEDFESAETDFDLAIQLDDEYALAYAHLAEIYLIYGDTDIERALSYAKQADSFNTDDDPYIDVILAQAYEANGDNESAIKAYQTAIDNGYENVDLLRQKIADLS